MIDREINSLVKKLQWYRVTHVPESTSLMVMEATVKRLPVLLRRPVMALSSTVGTSAALADVVIFTVMLPDT